MRFRKKPVVIDAMHYDGSFEGAQKVTAWMHSFDTQPDVILDIDRRGLVMGLHIMTLEGRMEVSPGDWVIRGVAGEFYPCKPAIFDQTYEAIGG